MYENLLANVPTDLWIGGQWRKASDGGRFDVIDPATENKIASVASATVEDAKAAVDAASDAFAPWAARKPLERGGSGAQCGRGVAGAVVGCAHLRASQAGGRRRIGDAMELPCRHGDAQ